MCVLLNVCVCVCVYSQATCREVFVAVYDVSPRNKSQNAGTRDTRTVKCFSATWNTSVKHEFTVLTTDNNAIIVVVIDHVLMGISRLFGFLYPSLPSPKTILPTKSFVSFRLHIVASLPFSSSSLDQLTFLLHSSVSSTRHLISFSSLVTLSAVLTSLTPVLPDDSQY